MGASQRYKPAGGIVSVAVVPAGAAAGRSPDEIAAAAAEVPLVEGRSEYEESADLRDGILRVEHRLTIAVSADYAHAHIGADVCRRWAQSGTAAVVATESGERFAVGLSAGSGCGQPLRLTSAAFATGTTPHTTPAVVLTFRSVDSAPAERVQTPESKTQNSHL